MTKSNSAFTIAGMVGAFALSFFATVLIRRSAPSAEVAPSAWTADAERAAKAREREESLSRSLTALRSESRRVNEQITRKREQLSARLSKARTGDADAKAGGPPDSTGELLGKLLIREKLRMGREDYGMNASQLETYEARLKEALEKQPLNLFETDKSTNFDEQILIPLLDREQYAKYQELTRKRAQEEAKSETQKYVELLSVDEETANKVRTILKEEGLDDPTIFMEAMEKPDLAPSLLSKVAGAADRVRARVQPLISPEAFRKLEGHFAEETEALKVVLEELRKETEK